MYKDVKEIILLMIEKIYEEAEKSGCENMQKIIVVVESQVNNTTWDERHWKLLKNVMKYLREKKNPTETDVERIVDMVEEHGLNIFRGTVTEDDGSEEDFAPWYKYWRGEGYNIGLGIDWWIK